ncbi:MAG: ribosome biogenesis GTPase YlqF [Lachnospiraceae bacterium]|nr:ribosome biogenesis GTPase YlqF [Lachnospiraceae bacterium]
MNTYQWYPGHMMKAMRTMREDIRLIDLVIELIEARAPISSRNPDIDTLSAGKARLVVLNKADLADPSVTEEFVSCFSEQGTIAVPLDSRDSKNVRILQQSIEKACEKKLLQNRKKGILNRPLRAMVTGIPNVGKSTLINTLSGKASAKTGNKPGVTKGKQWIRLNKQVELLDTPGIMPPKFESQIVGERLAMLGSINDDIIEKRELALSLIRLYFERDRQAFFDRYGIETLSEAEAYTKELNVEKLSEEDLALFLVAKKRGALKKAGEPDLYRAAGLVLEDYRSGRLGRMTLDKKEELL